MTSQFRGPVIHKSMTIPTLNGSIYLPNVTAEVPNGPTVITKQKCHTHKMMKNGLMWRVEKRLKAQKKQ